MATTIRRKPNLFPADCLVSDVVQHVVRISAAAVSGVYQATVLNPLSEPVGLPWGVIIAKQTTTRCIVQVGGDIVGVYSGLTPGRRLFIGDDGKLTHTVPVHPPSGVRSVHPAAQALSTDSLFLRIQAPVVIGPLNS